jgi:hypothetical protein
MGVSSIRSSVSFTTSNASAKERAMGLKTLNQASDATRRSGVVAIAASRSLRDIIGESISWSRITLMPFSGERKRSEATDAFVRCNGRLGGGARDDIASALLSAGVEQIHALVGEYCRRILRTTSFEPVGPVTVDEPAF